MFLHKARAAAAWPCAEKCRQSKPKNSSTNFPSYKKKGKDNDSKLLPLLDDNEPWWTRGKLYKCPFEEETMV